MLKIHTLPLGAYQTNCYIIHDKAAKSCVIIDPGYEPDVILDTLDALKLEPAAILLTHGHFDHVGAVRDVASETGCKVYLHEADLALPPMITAGKLYCTHTYSEGDELELAGLTLRVLHTPGHTPGSVCLMAEDAIFSGDTLFAGSCGRTDLPGGSPDLMAESLKRLAQMDGDRQVLPGHEGFSTLTKERTDNYWILYALKL